MRCCYGDQLIIGPLSAVEIEKKDTAVGSKDRGNRYFLPDLFTLSCHIKILHASVTQNLPSWIVFRLLAAAAAPLHQRSAIFGLNTHLLKSYMYMYVLYQLRFEGDFLT